MVQSVMMELGRQVVCQFMLVEVFSHSTLGLMQRITSRLLPQALVVCLRFTERSKSRYFISQLGVRARDTNPTL